MSRTATGRADGRHGRGRFSPSLAGYGFAGLSTLVHTHAGVVPQRVDARQPSLDFHVPSRANRPRTLTHRGQRDGGAGIRLDSRREAALGPGPTWSLGGFAHHSQACPLTEFQYVLPDLGFFLAQRVSTRGGATASTLPQTGRSEGTTWCARALFSPQGLT